MRLFVAVWPPPEVLDVIDRLPRPDHPGVRWTPRDRWHVTLRFLGEVDDDELPSLTRALAEVGAQHQARRVTLGPAIYRLARSVLVAPVTGLDDLGPAVTAATANIGASPEDRPFTGHLTLARARGRGAVPATLAGAPVDAAWDVAEVTLVRSRAGRYDTIASSLLLPSAESAHFRAPEGPEVGPL